MLVACGGADVDGADRGSCSWLAHNKHIRPRVSGNISRDQVYNYIEVASELPEAYQHGEPGSYAIVSLMLVFCSRSCGLSRSSY